MKILFLYDFPLWGSGSGTYIRNLIEKLIRISGYKIGVVAPDERRFLDDKIKQYRVEIPQIPVFVGHPEVQGAKRYSELSPREITTVYEAFLNTMIEAVANFEPDLIHVHHLSLISWVARYVSALKGIKYIITSHGSCLFHILSDRRYLSLSEEAARYAKAITTVSGDSRSKLLKLLGPQYNKNVYIIPGAVNINYFPLRLETPELNEKYQLSDKKIVLFTGRLISHKGVRYLVKAAKDIKAEVYLVGDGPERQYLEALIAQKNIKNVHLLGYLSGQDLVHFYYRAQVFVAPSVIDEALGLTILEAMASSTPVISTRKGGIPTLIKHGFNGFFVKPKNAKNIAEMCNKLLENDVLRTTMGTNARKTIEEKFTWEKTANSFDRLYKKVLRIPNGKNHKLAKPLTAVKNITLKKQESLPEKANNA